MGKSTLIGALGEMRKAEREVAVLSIDPSSPFTRGALLGDRIRLSEHFLDAGVFIRSMASRGALGGLSEAALQAALLMDAAGKDDVLIETVGVGQAEIDIVDHADTIVLALMPGSGDSIQALKAGVMEIPDVIVVNKADHPLTDTMVREIRGVLSLGPHTHGKWEVPRSQDGRRAKEGVGELRRGDRQASLVHKEWTSRSAGVAKKKHYQAGAVDRPLDVAEDADRRRAGRGCRRKAGEGGRVAGVGAVGVVDDEGVLADVGDLGDREAAVGERGPRRARSRRRSGSAGRARGGSGSGRRPCRARRRRRRR